MGKYNFDLDMNSNNSLANILNNININSSVLEFGPAHGRMTKYLKETLNCKTCIVEIDQPAAMQAHKYSNMSFIGEDDGNIEKYKWHEYLTKNNIKFNYIIFADVLEHIYDPLTALIKSKDVLEDNGSIWISIPNISHNSVIIDLMNNKFEYRETGILDNTHIRFFTYESLKGFILEAGLEVVSEANTTCTVEDSEFNNSYDNVSNKVADVLKSRKFGEIYQFIWELKVRK